MDAWPSLFLFLAVFVIFIRPLRIVWLCALIWFSSPSQNQRTWQSKTWDPRNSFYPQIRVISSSFCSLLVPWFNFLVSFELSLVEVRATMYTGSVNFRLR